jgi:G protein-coupled receptor GPR1
MATQEEWAFPLLAIRDDDGDHASNNTSNISDSQVLALEAVSVTFATISVFAAFIAFYWFVRMRRSFRQDLIMLLIQSDMMKAFWLMISPIIYFIAGPDGPINSNSAFCQISGFFLTTAIEASDIAVLMIAIHSALYILRIQTPGGETGLHPYRRYAYIIWLVVPLVMAAVIPITGSRFADNGPFCYLPGSPGWYRVYLSWVPRYIIFGIIFFVYAFLYVYVAWRFRKLRLDQKRASFQSMGSPKSQLQRFAAIPPTPPLTYNGLLDLSNAQTPMEIRRERRNSATSDVSTLKLNEPTPTPGAPPVQEEPQSHEVWNWVMADHEGATNPAPRRDATGPALPAQLTDVVGSPDIDTPAVTRPQPVAPRISHSGTVPVTQTPKPRIPPGRQSFGKPFWQRPLSFASDTVISTAPRISSMLQRDTPEITDGGESSFPSLYAPLSVTEDSLRKSRDKMNRQLRLLFVYPLIYIIAWVAPFVSHVYKYQNPTGVSMQEPYGAMVVSIASLCFGAAVDCIFYTAWEKPWRFSRVGFWEGLALRLRLRRRPRVGGRSREEQRRDASAAFDRRNVEQQDRQAAAAMGRARTSRTPREWWDIEEQNSQ